MSDKQRKKLNVVMVEITDKCNLNCKHCMNRTDYIGIETEVAKLKKLFDKASAYGTNRITLSGGEPFLHKDILEIIDLCHLYPEITFLITTNGLLLTEPIMQMIEKQKNVTIQFSIDGVTKETYESIRGKNTFSVFQEKMNIWDNSSVKSGLARTCLTKSNYKELEQIYEYCLMHRLIPSFLFVDSLGNGKNNWDELDTSLAEKVWCINMINKLNKKYNCSVPPPESPATCNFTEGTGVCALLIRVTGRVAPCQFFYDESIGNAFTDDIYDILHNEKLNHLINVSKERKKILEESEKCKKCKVKQGCHYGCVGKANKLGDIMSYDGECERRVIMTTCYSNRLITLNEKAPKDNSIRYDIIV